MKMLSGFGLLILLSLGAIGGLTGCSHVPEKTLPAVVGSEGWSELWIKLSDDRVIYCLDKGRDYKSWILSCDWDEVYSLSELPDGVNVKTSNTGNLFSEGYVKDSRGVEVMCLFANYEAHAGVMSCDWDSAHNR